jgi:hypothetical protein
MSNSGQPLLVESQTRAKCPKQLTTEDQNMACGTVPKDMDYETIPLPGYASGRVVEVLLLLSRLAKYVAPSKGEAGVQVICC